ncbi:MAG: hypothetical protein PHT54_04935, partial [Candidatus Nanoarchaeia archaeon]|nr:hypothetical protein [Candidatus Nanoarchaeia archaeon]
MEKKRERFILLSVLVAILVLFGSQIIRADLSTSSTTMTATGDAYNLNNLTKGGVEETINVTIVHDGTGDNISHFNITWDTGNYTFLYFVDREGGSPDFVPGYVVATNEFANLSNATWDADDAVNLEWMCMNLTATSISCFNNSVDLLSVGK